MKAQVLLEKLKEAGVHTVIYGFGSVLQTAIGYILIPLYTRYYTTDVFGVFALLTVVGALAGSLFKLGIAPALARSYFEYPDGEERRRIAGTSVVMAAVAGVVQIALAVLLARQVSVALFDTTDYSVHVMLVITSAAVTSLSNLGLRLLRLERRSVSVVVANVISLVVTSSLIIYLLVVRELGVMAPILGTLVGGLFFMVTLGIMCRRYFTLGLVRSEVRRQLRYGMPIMLSGFGYYLLDWIDRFLIKEFGSLGDVGVYSLGYKIGVSIHILFIIPFSQIWDPMRMEYKDEAYLAPLHSVVITYYSVIGLTIATTISVFAPEVVAILASRPEYQEAYRVIPLVMIGHLLFGSTNILDTGIAFARRTYLTTVIIWLLAVFNFAGNYVLIPIFGYMGAAYTTLASYAIMAYAVHTVAGKFYPIRIQSRIFMLLALAVGTIVVGLRLGETDLRLTTMVLTKSVVMVGFLVLTVLMVLDRRERAFMRRTLSKLTVFGTE